MNTRRDDRIVRKLVAWFDAARRDLPWRRELPGGGRDPYRVLVSEVMLQQTQVARVLDKYDAFLSRFPNPRALARANLGDVLAEWSGLGYYRRARLLHAAACAIVASPARRLHPDLNELKSLPGVGRYTAGAVASLAFNMPAPIVDGNVARVLSRLDGDVDASAARTLTWDRADALVRQAAGHNAPGRFNEALMELGALVCTPRSPRCDACPLSRECEARRLGAQDRFPAPAKAGPRRQVHALCAAIRDPRGRLLVEQRPDTGLWASLWQLPTIERESTRAPTRAALSTLLGLKDDAAWRRLGSVRAVLSHRVVSLTILEPRERLAPGARRAMSRGRRWGDVPGLKLLGLSSAHARAIAVAAQATCDPTIA